MPFPERAISEVNKIDPDARMKCHRCDSTMVYQKFYGLRSIFGDGGVSAVERLQAKSFWRTGDLSQRDNYGDEEDKSDQ